MSFFTTRTGRMPLACAAFLVVATMSSLQAAESDWSRANRSVDEAGGWKAYLRESQAAQAEAEATAFRPDRSPAHRAKAWQAFSQQIDYWLNLAMVAQPGLRPATDALVRVAGADAAWLVTSASARATFAQSLRVSRPLMEEVIAWAYAQEAHQRHIQREDLADVAWELARRMHTVGNLPLQDERESRLHLLEIRAARQKAEARLLQAREALADRARAAGLNGPTTASVVLPFPPASKQPQDDALLRDAMGRVVMLLSADTRSAVSSRAVAQQHPKQTQPYALVQAYAALAYAEQQLRLATDRVQLLVEEGLPAQQTISEEHLLSYNGMLIGTPKLLKDRDKAMALELEVLEALRDYWLARSRRDHQQAAVLLEEIFWGVTR